MESEAGFFVTRGVFLFFRLALSKITKVPFWSSISRICGTFYAANRVNFGGTF
jgi:hypothetical protein